MNTTKHVKTMREVRSSIEVISEYMRLDLMMLNAGELTLDEYTHRMGIWMRTLADNTGSDRGDWELDA